MPGADPVPFEARDGHADDRPASTAVGVAPGLADEVYLGSRLRYGPVDTSVAGLVDSALIRSLLVRAVMFWAVCMLGALVASVFLGVLIGDVGHGFSLMFMLANLASWLIFVIPIRLPVSEWHWVIEGRAEASRTAYAQILAAFRDRKPPASIELRRAVRTVDKHGRDYLRARQGRLSAHISAFAYGRDLYVGWTLWWGAMPPVIVWDYLRQLAASLVASGATYVNVMRADEAKAFREVVHAATRQGVDAAFRNDQVQLPTFGSSIPVDRIPSWL